MNFIVRYEDTTKRKPRELYRAQVSEYSQDQWAYGLTLLEMYGQEQVVRSIAYYLKGAPVLAKARTIKEIPTVKILRDGHSSDVRMDPNVAKQFKIVSIPDSDRPGYMTLIMLHPHFSRMDGRFMLGGTEEEPSPWFPRSFQNLIKVPFLFGWGATLWRVGIENGLINNRGIYWSLNTDSNRWQKLIGRLVKEGQLHG